jgi:environmental stress-induced protein Ves
VLDRPRATPSSARPTDTVKLLSADSRRIEPWKNGRGQSATVESTAGWRVSVAEKDASPFSSFPGAGRILMALSPAGVVLSVNGQRRALACHQPVKFEGEDAANALELRGSTEVLNLIWQPHTHSEELHAVSVAASLKLEANAAVLIAVVTAGALTIQRGLTLERLDALCPDQTRQHPPRGSVPVRRRPSGPHP